MNVAVDKKVSALRIKDYFRERAQRANRTETLRILDKAGKGNPPMEGDELPADWAKPSRRGRFGKKPSLAVGSKVRKTKS